LDSFDLSKVDSKLEDELGKDVIDKSSNDSAVED
jgi:hypothetical protein